MKTMKISLFLALAAVALTACNKDDVAPATDGNNSLIPGETVTVNFTTKAPAFSTALETRAAVEKYPTANFRMMAFRNNGTDFVYLKDVEFSKITYDPDNSQFNGTAQLPVGVYKFVPAYNLPKTSDAHVTLTEMDANTVLNNDLTASHKGTLPAIYLRNDANIPESDLGTHTGTANVVTSSIKRAVSRIDVLFVRATKNADGTYQEIATDDVFGGHPVKSIVLDVKGLTPSVRLIDGGVAPGEAIPTSFTVVNQVKSDNNNTTGSTIGNGTPEKRYDFDNVLGEHIMKGGVYAYGPYVFPYASEGETANLTLTVTSEKETADHIYERAIDVNRVKLMRNKVTIIKIYALNDNFFNTEVGFDIDVQDAWDGSYTVDVDAK